jgi:hypothetical protein
VTFTASGSIFTASMVGRQIWRQSQNGIGTGRAQITAYISDTQVTCNILTSFNTVMTIPAGQWYLTTDVITGIWHLNGEYVDVIADGGDASPVGSITDGFGRSLVQVVNGSQAESSELIAVHDTVNAYINTVLSANTGSNLGIFTVNTLAGMVELKYSGNNPGNFVKVHRLYITV